MIQNVIINNRKKQIRELKKEMPLSLITEKAFNQSENLKKADLYNTLRVPRISLIGEIKKASPYHSTVRVDFDPVRMALEIAHAGAAAISVITEETYFKGSEESLREISKAVNIPVICKDYIFDEWQLCWARILGADAVIIKASILDLFELKKMIGVADMLGMQSLIEVRNEEQVSNALRAGAKIVIANNRNQATYETDLQLTEKLRRLVPPEISYVSAGGIKSSGDIERMSEAGVNAVMVGEALMNAVSVAAKVQELMTGRI